MFGTAGKPHARVSALIAAAIWSGSATVVGQLQGARHPYLIVFAVQIVGLIALTFYLRRQKLLAPLVAKFQFAIVHAFKDGKFRLPSLVVGTFVFALSLYLYQLVFYWAMTTSGRMFANIANYLWPILLVITNHYVFQTEPKSPSIRTVFAMSIGFLGVSALVLISPSGGNLHLLPVLLGAGAAIAASLYMGQAVALARRHDLKAPEVWWAGLVLSVTVQMIGVPIALPYMIMSFGYPAVHLDAQLLSGIAVVAYLGIATVAIAQVFWTKSIAEKEDDVPYVIIYLTPVASTVIQMIVLKDQPSAGFFLGMTLIVASIFLTMRVYATMTAEAGAAVVFMYLGFLAFFSSRIDVASWKTPLGDMPVEVFGVLAAFLLSRQWDRLRAEAVALSAWASTLTDLNNHLFRMREDRNEVKRRLKQELANLYTAVVDYDQSSTTSTSLSGYQSLIRKIEKYAQASRALARDSAEGDRVGLTIPEGEDPEFENCIRRLHDHTGRWVGLKSHLTSLSDIAALLVLILIAVFSYVDLLVAPGESHFIGQFLLMAMVSVFAFLAIRVQAYNGQPTFRSLNDIQRLQFEGRRFEVPLYLGDINKLTVTAGYVPIEGKIRYTVAGKPIDEFGGDPSARLYKHLRRRTFAALALLIGPAAVAIVLAYQAFGLK